MCSAILISWFWPAQTLTGTYNLGACSAILIEVLEIESYSLAGFVFIIPISGSNLLRYQRTTYNLNNF